MLLDDRFLLCTDVRFVNPCLDQAPNCICMDLDSDDAKNRRKTPVIREEVETASGDLRSRPTDRTYHPFLQMHVAQAVFSQISDVCQKAFRVGRDIYELVARIWVTHPHLRQQGPLQHSIKDVRPACACLIRHILSLHSARLGSVPGCRTSGNHLLGVA